MVEKRKSENKTKTPAKLFRSQNDRVVAGVCTGLGEFFQIDATIIRLIFIIVTLFGGGGLLLYLILWLIIPSQGSDSEITKENIDKGVNEMKDKARDITESIKLNSTNLNTRQFLGIIILAFGAILLLDNFGIVNIARLWRFIPALVIIFLGISILKKRE
ncbi:MAG: Phage shock protein C, PspC [Candidatus Woesebacteria bacterium GW2011_GWD1_38_10]|uniref:Phage shock protein C, PspC n=1 Tax=Candidatus Woesebacteria bacterium GW2011_GWD1_38_10 TaxID=1618592 RepID=A0A0G0IER7_9BACT|nr:MAG: Phage shock protein C, PspC [Candidatus Woesebacteria bacterium GW2011_GWD1_38_10]